MSLIEKNDFQVFRGGVPGNYEGCHDAAMEINNGVIVASGNIVTLDAGTGKYNLATLADGAIVLKALYMVIEGNSANDSYAGEFTGKVAGLRGTFRVQTKQFNATAMAIGALVSVVAGKLEVAAAKPAVGEVLSYDAVSGIIIVDLF